ncbi:MULTISPECIES: type IV pilus assembly protein FimV [unclassified Janthinobacterium]|uniref:type IV pilus assembly protein FimV n=1 Tax=unclassified Janthinobacterium TaxID=2610881 RepID=UPI000347EF22|nr:MULTISPECIES: hypothetical protein [unclassified Janthinobacterium]MEC5162981.1 hypothetical protein [Janthinobacterium sp. CG_S6]
MQRSAPFSLIRRAGVIATAALACAGAAAAELGEPSVRSYLGQPLVAEIELTALAPDEVAGLQVRLASPDVYRGANISMDPVLQTVHLAVLRREQRQYLRVTSPRRVDADYLHLYLELSAGGRSAVRAVTLWLSADPAPASTPAPAPAPVIAHAPVPASPAAAVSEAAPSPALVAARARAAMPERREPAPAPAPAMARPPSHKPPRQAAAAPAVPHTSVPAQLPTPEAAATCGPGSAGQAKACRVLDQKNAALTSKLVELEGKIKILQRELLPGQAGLKPQPISALAPLKAKPKPLAAAAKKAPATSPMPLALVGGGAVALLLLIGAALYLYWRRKKAAVPGAPSTYWVLLRKPFRRKKALEGADAAAVEPVLDE